MGFIYGVINLDRLPAVREEAEVLGKATGWDNFISQTALYGNVALGFCHHPERKSKAGLYIDEEVIVLADIRIYNQDELKQIFYYQSNEEVLAKAWLRWGIDWTNHINGDFAVFIFDKRDHCCYLFRDHIGTRPLVYWSSQTKLIFSSHEFGLAKSGLIKAGISENRLIDNFFHYIGNYEQSVFDNVKKVIPGYFVTFSAETPCRKIKYWEPEKIQKDNVLTFETATGRLRELLIKATCSRMENVRTGMHVSGGIDSCGVASIVADNTPDKNMLTGYSWTPIFFDGQFEGVNEKEFIEAFSADKKVRMRYLNLDEYETTRNALIPEFFIQHIEHPVMQMAHKDGVEILFSGWGGDEFVSLSSRGTFNHLFFNFKWRQLYKIIREKGVKSSIYKFRTEIFPLFLPFGLLPSYKAGKKDWSCFNLFNPGFIRKHWQQIFLRKNKNVFGYGNRTRLSLNLIEHYHLPERMDSWAVNAEHYGYEYKYPLLDKELLEFWFSIPVEFTYKDFHSRLLYREAMKGILTEKIRIRAEKGEAIRLAFSFRENQKGKKYLEQLFYSLSSREHLSYFRPRAFKKVFRNYDSKNKLKRIRARFKVMLYLRYVALVKKYIPER
jgi:asparagine synthetase B (glutamine-hydrolysing)